MADIFTPEKRSFIMSKIKGRDTALEMAVRKKLWRMGIRYKVNSKDVPGKPDIVFKSQKIAVFIDGCFWHGCPKCYYEPKSGKEFWRKKISANKKRRKKVLIELKKSGWKILQFWGHEIETDLCSVVSRIRSELTLNIGRQV